MHSAAGADLPGRGRRVAVGISGGVDSAVAALLLQWQGYEVVGVFMRNWDEGEETGNQNCSGGCPAAHRGGMRGFRRGAPGQAACAAGPTGLGVFSEFLAQCGRGLTPNPDLACNRHIKFDALLSFAGQLGAGLVATGHYARLAPGGGGGGGGGVSLLRGADRLKDQSYFLASVQPAALRRVLFPVGHLSKAEVRRLAAAAGLATADKRSSAGICFIGRRNFAAFLGQYLAPLPGRYVDVGSGAVLGTCPDLAAVTHGQRPGIGGAPERVYAVGKDVVERVVYVAQGRGHPALLCTTALLRTPHWLSAGHAAQLAAQGWLRCQYKARYGQQPRPSERLGFRPSAYCRLQPQDSRMLGSYLVVRFDEPGVAITPQQACVLYDGELCLGAALIALPGTSLHEEAGGDGSAGQRLDTAGASA
ncbi:hypothetical protein CHLNCDRAFT_35486 [Chlorella variabilis]|uniref:tRNA-5-taurinomethyluridine 2-sulfurtransferase n=1 Tax=Chlorella variabilis TaxID=554065 RepID=E1ZF29_CHLVA|nr:hypothetical protein CHLNCDRAFT_35486 [Chlorella variabilis]EFN55599.1 hypothetical protein CHLNCDRAFT_35486 [Chlorella variabilis]|eukprot:XP_005847701.1 hypothetical protein CHLNCDRAFT_35486 [Chlorella variabilis]